MSRLPSLPPDLDWSALDRYVADECSSDERLRVEVLLEASLVWRATMAGLRAQADTQTTAAARAVVKGALARIQGEHMSPPSPAPLPRRGARSPILGSSGFLQGSFLQRPLRQFLLAGMVIAAGAVAVFFGIQSGPHASIRAHVYTATNNSVALMLADGSHVVLAPHTRLQTASGFGERVRTVVLTGQAFFRVTKTQGAPFIVQTGTISTRVLGTTFEVRHYMSDTAIRIVVASGKVATGGRRYTPVTLIAGTVAHATDSTVVMTHVNETGAYTSWIHGQLVFRQVTIPELLRVVGQWYGVEFRVGDPSLAMGHITLTLDHETEPSAMAILASALDATMTLDTVRTGTRVITLHRRRTAYPHVQPKVPMQQFHPPYNEVGR